MIIGFDMDGVIIDHADRKVYIAKKLGYKIKIEHTPSEILKGMMPLKTYRHLQHLLYDNLKTSIHSPLVSGIKPILAKIKKQNLPYFLISRRKIEGPAIRLLSSHGLWPKYFNEKNTFFVREVE